MFEYEVLINDALLSPGVSQCLGSVRVVPVGLVYTVMRLVRQDFLASLASRFASVRMERTVTV